MLFRSSKVAESIFMSLRLGGPNDLDLHAHYHVHSKCTFFSGDIKEYPKEMRIKAVLYIVLRMVKDDIDTQRKGAIVLFWMHEISIDDFKTRSYVHKKLVPALPLRASAFHLFLPSDIIGNERLMQLGKAMYMLAIGTELRSRLRVHSGMFNKFAHVRFFETVPGIFIHLFTTLLDILISIPLYQSLLLSQSIRFCYRMFVHNADIWHPIISSTHQHQNWEKKNP